jgi:hypothetical protein
MLGLGGVIAVLGFIVGIPLGIYFVTRKEDDRLAGLKAQPRFQSLSDVELLAVTRWSWGAFFGLPIWALGNRLWLWFLGSLVPFWNLYVWIKLSADGRRMAFERSVLTVAAFERRQKIIAWIIAVFVVLGFGANVIQAFTSEHSSKLTSEPSHSSIVVTEIPSSTAKRVEVLPAKEQPDRIESDGDSYCDGGRDSDGDGLLNDFETKYYGTDPLLTDTDGDGYSDFDELKNGYNPNDLVALPDTDGDGLANAWEQQFYLTDMSDPDTDHDGMGDRDELRAGLDPEGDGSVSDLLARNAPVWNRLKAQCR